jgi:hypothetical protein
MAILDFIGKILAGIFIMVISVSTFPEKLNLTNGIKSIPVFPGAELVGSVQFRPGGDSPASTNMLLKADPKIKEKDLTDWYTTNLTSLNWVSVTSTDGLHYLVFRKEKNRLTIRFDCRTDSIPITIPLGMLYGNEQNKYDGTCTSFPGSYRSIYYDYE